MELFRFLANIQIYVEATKYKQELYLETRGIYYMKA